MKLHEIREIVSKFEHDKPNCRTAIRQFLTQFGNDYQVGLTLTLNQKWYTMNGLMRVDHYLTEKDLPKIYERFEHKLNKFIWKQKYYRYNAERIQFFRAWENGNGTKRIHLHAALGNFPQGFKFNTLPKLVEMASKECYEIDHQHKEEICGSGWLEYITKEVGEDNTDKILW